MNKVIQHSNTHYLKNQMKTMRMNRTALATAIGAVGFVDLALQDAASTTVEAGQDNIVAVTTARIALLPMLLVATEVVADDVRCSWHEGDAVECYILVEGTVAVVAGDKLKPVNAQNYMVKATVATDYWYAVALGPKAAAGSALVRCLLFSTGRR